MSPIEPPEFETLEQVSASLELASPQEILSWAMRTYGARLTMATAFGDEGCALIAMIAKLRDEDGLIVPDVFNLDTGYQFQETLDLRDRIVAKYGIDVRFVRAAESTMEMEERNGGPIYGTNPTQCCYERKVVPLRDAVQGFGAWITAIRRDQTPERAEQPIVGPEPKFEGLVKINPLANWTKEQVAEFVRENDVPTNPLRELGYRSIGCYPCTRAVQEGEDDRAGRWSGSNKKECGLHLAEPANARPTPQPVKLFF